MNHKKQDGHVLQIASIVAFILIIGLTIYLYVENSQYYSSIPSENSLEKITAGVVYSATGVTTICINAPPQIIYDCNYTTINTFRNETITCQLIATDIDNNTLTFSSEFLTYPEVFNITPSGLINFTPGRNAVGDNTFRIYVHDNSSCSNNYTYKDYVLSVLYDNRAPQLIQEIPNQNIAKNQLYSFYFTDYFTDPDDDELSYLNVILSTNTIKMTTLGDLVTIRGESCGVTSLYYIAVDYAGLTATSNVVTYNVTCLDTSTSSQDGSNSAGDGGDGSGEDEETDCSSDWRCSAWTQCNQNNASYRRCIDYNGCSAKHYEKYFKRSCMYQSVKVYCKEKWDCNEWSTCTDGFHERTCLDLNACETNNTKPIELETCTRINSCFNGIQDGTETGVDCGGLCGVCRNLESPKRTNPIIATVIVAGITVGITALAAFLFRSNILHNLNSLRPKKTGRKIYINPRQKEKLLQIINLMQSRINEKNVDLSIEYAITFVHEYFKQLIATEKLDKKELLQRITSIKDRDLEKMLVMFYAKITNTTSLHYKSKSTTLAELQAIIDEMTHNIYLIGSFDDVDAINAIKERPIASSHLIDIIYGKLSNLYIALNFKEISVAKQQYRDALKAYDMLSKSDKIKVNNDITRAFHSIGYSEKLLKK